MRLATTYFIVVLVLFTIVSGVFYHHTNREVEKAKIEIMNELAKQGHATNQKINDITMRVAGVHDAVVIQGDQFSKSVMASDQKIREVANAVKDLGGTLVGELSRIETESKKEIGQLQQRLVQVNVKSKDFSDIIEVALKATVSIRTERGYGSGVIVDEDLYVVTNYHVIEGINSGVGLTYDRESHQIRIVGYDKNLDIAVLQLQTSKDYPRLKFGNSDYVKAGNKAIALGNPGGLDFTVTEGIISSTSRETPAKIPVFQIDVPINPGNSGGPLVDATGRIIGINTVKLKAFEGIGFSIKSNIIEPIVKAIIQKDKES